MNRRAILCFLVASLALCGCRRGAVPPPASPTTSPRIVALSPALAIILRDLGVAGQIVGRHGWDMVLDPSVPVCGDQAGIDYEALLRAAPTHVLLEWGSRPLPPRLDELARERNWEVVNYTLLTLDDLTAAAGDLQRRFAPEAPSLAARMTAAWSPRPGGLGGAGRILLLLSVDPPAALGPGSFHQQILERLGATPAITEGKPYITMDAEDVLRLAPDAIVLIAPRGAEAPARAAPATPDQVRAILGRIGELDIPAVHSGRMALIDDPLSLTPSSAMIDFADRLVGVLGEWNQ